MDGEYFELKHNYLASLCICYVFGFKCGLIGLPNILVVI